MSVESATKIQELNPANPLDADPTYQGAAHIRMIKECLKNVESAFVPAGSVIAFAGASAPAGWLLCNGATLLKANYPDLATVLGTTYGPGDATHFVLPDYRGKFLRGLNSSSSGVDHGRTLGDLQYDAVITHTHSANHAHTASIADHTHTSSDFRVNTAVPLWLNGGSSFGSADYTETTSGATYTSSPAVTVNEANVTTLGPLFGGLPLAEAVETRPINVSVNYIIKY